ncbi:MAG: DUF3365 domain-containing protein [Desulfobacula sp.]|nr:DUF3365 domain-containing protein [Desulfobacula sp.]
MTLEKKEITSRLFWYYSLGIILTWTLFISLSLFWHQKILHSGSIEAARIQARNVFQNHVIYRSWNAMHGGVYAKITPKTQPNPYLEVDERDILTPSGTKLTKINPAFMTRQANELAFEKYGIIAHITSLKPIRPQNQPDAWESWALKQFEQGSHEISTIETINNIQYLRLMRPLITEQGCLKCHDKQGYKKGDIRGGISVGVPLAQHLAISKNNLKTLTMMYGFIWFAGITGTILFMLILNKQISKRLKAEKELIHREKLEGVVEMARAVCHELNQPLQMILGNSEIILMEGTDKETLLKRVKLIQEQVNRMGKLSRKLIKIASYETKEMPQGKVIDIDKSSGLE